MGGNTNTPVRTALKCSSVNNNALRKKIFLIFLLTLFFTCGCGYKFSLEDVRPSSKGVSVRIRTVFIAPFVNKTQFRGLENLLQNALVYEFTTGQGLKVVPKEQAEAVLTGELLDYQETSTGYTRQEYATTGRVSLAIKTELKDPNGNIIWQNPYLYDQENFQFGGSPSQTEDNKKEAIRRILERIAQRIYENLRVSP